MLRVIGAGFGRTGTLSLKLALERLGFGPCHHMLEVFADPSQAGVFLAAHRGQDVDWDEVYGAYAATVDFPGAVFWEELAAAYPDAKVLLSVRPAAEWYASARATIFAAMDTPGGQGGPSADEPDDIALLRTMATEVIRDGLFGGRLDDPGHCMAVYEAHNRRVMTSVPDDRLVVWEVGSGWEPLCAGLGVPVPDEPFPRTNTREEFARVILDRPPPAGRDRSA